MAAGGLQTYVFDTSALIDGIERFYPTRNFPRLWEALDSLIDEGRLRVAEEAWAEAIHADAPLKEWCLEADCARENSIYPTDLDVARVAGEIGIQFPKWVQQGGKNQADPFVIATAELNGWTVISGETNGGPGKPKIPYVCTQRGVTHGRFVDVVRSEDWILA